MLLLYFSGHGIKDDRGKLYLATRNTSKTQQGELIRSTSVSANFIHDRMSESRSRRQVVILDSCFSGAFAEGMPAKDDGTIDIRQQLGGEGRVVLTSSSSTQYSFEQKGQDLSIYTRFLIEGIKSGEADRDRDGFISTDELHEYAKEKVRELQPQMKPEIYAIREGYKILLTKVAPGDPRQQYRKEVALFIRRDKISRVGRHTLDILRTRLRLDTTEAKAIEDEVLEPYPKEFREKLQEYQQVFAELLERDETITDGDRHDLQILQQRLGLRDEDTMPIEALVTAQFKTHQQNLETYQQAFTTALRQEFPLSAASRDHLRQIQSQLELANGDIAAIESQITAEVEAYHQKLQDYQRLFFTATQQEYPLSEATRNNLRQQQQRLGLTDVDVAPIEAQITTQIESYHQKLQQYEQAFVKATQRQHYPDEVTRKQLQQTWQTLGLREGDVGAIERRIDAETSAIKAIIIQSSSEAEYRKEQETIRQEPPIQQSSPVQPTQPPQDRITRQTFLKWAGLGSVGLVTGVAGLEFFKGQSPKYITVKFETVSVDQKGQVIKRDSNKQAKLFKEDLGNGITLDMVEIPGGSFNMGSPFGENGRTQSEEPQHAVNVPAFFMGKFEVTQEQYQQIMGSNPSFFKGAKRPVQGVSWNDAVEFCRKLSQKTGREYRLPSEAKWEYACRAGTTTPFHFGEPSRAELIRDLAKV
ncbi:SUMF1/EgtB/PvdO family nonheme iron enzyme [Nostoc sp.]|uniref:SUMF1/EgtB/PvdO family nonheme iron enzyme n=1 Tax=Nostoc sp. TaxID=1180 RepID=UPI002FF57F8B